MRRALLEAAVAVARHQFDYGARIAVSRGATPSLTSALGAHFVTVEAATARGRAVWKSAGDVTGYVVEEPNWFGLTEPIPRSSCVLIQAHVGAAAPSGMWRVMCDGRTLHPNAAPWVATDHNEPRTLLATILAKHIRQIEGAHLAHSLGEAPWFVALLPVDPGRVADRLDSSVVSATPVNRSELPGGIRLTIREGAQRGAIREYAAALEAAVARVHRGG